MTVPLADTPPVKPPRVWKFWATLIWGLIAFGALVVAQTAAAIVMMVRMGLISADGQGVSSEVIANLTSNGPLLSAAALAGAPAVLFVLWLAVWFARQSFGDYLALQWPERRDAVLGIVSILIFLGAWDLLSVSLGTRITPKSMIDVYTSAREAGALWALALALCVAAPITEEFAVRGFLYHGWSQSRLGGVGAVVLTSAAWAVVHSQYSWYFVTEIFCIGLILGYWRRRSGSTLLPVGLHTLTNGLALLQAMWLAGAV